MSFITFSTNRIIFKSMNHFYNFLNADMKLISQTPFYFLGHLRFALKCPGKKTKLEKKKVELRIASILNIIQG